MTNEELEARVKELEQMLNEKTAEFEKVTAEHHEIITNLEHQVKDLETEKTTLEEVVKDSKEKIVEQRNVIDDLEAQIEALIEGGSIPPTADGIIHGIIGLPEAEKFALAFMARTEQEGRDAFITMIYGKAPGSTSAEDHGHDHTHSFSEKVA